MYVLTYKDKVFLGPKEWHSRMFQTVIEDDYGVTATLPRVDPNGRFDVNADIVIRPVEFASPPSFNPKIERLAGPFFIPAQDKVVGYYSVEYLPIDSVKNALKATAADLRWKIEVGGLTMNIQGQDIRVTTARGDRDVFAQAFQLGADNVSWKFDSTTWLILSNAEIGTIVQAIVAHVQSQYEWELNKINEIDSCTTLSQLDTITFPDDPTTNNPGTQWQL